MCSGWQWVGRKRLAGCFLCIYFLSYVQYSLAGRVCDIFFVGASDTLFLSDRGGCAFVMSTGLLTICLTVLSVVDEGAPSNPLLKLTLTSEQNLKD